MFDPGYYTWPVHIMAIHRSTKSLDFWLGLGALRADRSKFKTFQTPQLIFRKRKKGIQAREPLDLYVDGERGLQNECGVSATFFGGNGKGRLFATLLLIFYHLFGLSHKVVTERPRISMAFFFVVISKPFILQKYSQ